MGNEGLSKQNESTEIRLDFGNFHLYKAGIKLKKEDTVINIKPSSVVHRRMIQKLKKCMSLIRMGYHEDGAGRIGVDTFLLNEADFNTLRSVFLFLHGLEGNVSVIIKYRSISLVGQDWVKEGEIHGG